MIVRTLFYLLVKAAQQGSYQTIAPNAALWTLHQEAAAQALANSKSAKGSSVWMFHATLNMLTEAV